MKVEHGTKSTYPPGDYPFEVITCEEDSRKGHKWLIVRIVGTDPTDETIHLTSKLWLGNWTPPQLVAFLEGIGLPGDAECEATDLIGKTGLAYWREGKPSTSKGHEGKRFLEPTETTGAPYGFYPKEDAEVLDGDDDEWQPPE